MKKLFIPFILFFVFSLNVVNAIEKNPFQRLMFHGDVSTKWISEFGGNDFHSFRSEANLGCDYTLMDSWVSIKMKAATVNGKESCIFLDKAFLGYQLFDSEKGSLTIEIGRNKMSSLFDSKLQFESYFNGVHFVYSFNQINLFNFTLHGGPFVVNSENNHYGWMAEGIWEHIGDKPLTLKYSFTDWNAPKVPKYLGDYRDEAYLYSVSQLLLSYQLYSTSVYAAYLLNHQYDTHNDGFYFGVKTGKIQAKGDIAVDVNFQSCKENVVSYMDSKGFKKGVNLKGCYALLDGLNLEAKLSLFDDYNGTNNNKRLEISAIYTW